MRYNNMLLTLLLGLTLILLASEEAPPKQEAKIIPFPLERRKRT